VVTVVPGKSDAEKAAELKDRIVEALVPVMEILDEGYKHGLSISYSIGPSALGKATILQLNVTKTF
jgi:hypothetical protein